MESQVAVVSQEESSNHPIRGQLGFTVQTPQILTLPAQAEKKSIVRGVIGI